MKSLHFKLFWRYAILILSIITSFMIVLYYIWGNTLRNNATSELLADCDNISTLLDTQMEQMNDISKRIVNSARLKELFTEDLYSNSIEAYNNKREFSNALFDIIRLSFDHMELNMFDTSNRHIYVGMTSSFTRDEEDLFSLAPWGSSVLDAYGKKVLLPTRYPELNTTETPVISLCRAFAPQNPTRETAILELQIHYSYLSQKISGAVHNQKDKKKIFVYDQEGNLVYPYNASVSSREESHILNLLSESRQNAASTLVSNKDSTLYTYKTSDETGWTVFVSESEKDLFLSFYQFRALIVPATVMILILTLFITNRIATGLSTPIKKLEQTARSLTLDNLDSVEFQNDPDSFQELTSLYRSFDQMKTNLSASLQDVVSAHTMAVDAQMLALQSQMNPHFLYNTLASISILAEDGEDDNIIRVCEDLSMLLRYISSGSSTSVALWQEIKHTQAYINLIKIKYEERIQFHMDIDEALLPVQVPRLIVQPLVENCTKYGLEVTPPWIITITGYIKNSCWIIQVQDNGSGFSQEYLDTFYEKTARLNPENPLSNLSINGMGLLNLYIRLHLLYKDQMIFTLENITDGGARVTVGGPIPQISGGEQNEL